MSMFDPTGDDPYATAAKARAVQAALQNGTVKPSLAQPAPWEASSGQMIPQLPGDRPPGYAPPTSTPGPAAPTPPAAGPAAGGMAPPGWDNAKWNDPNKHDPKYDIGHLIAGAHTSADLQALLPQIQKLYPGTTFDGKDALSNPLWGTADVLQGASTGHGNAQWLIPGAGHPGAVQGALGGANAAFGPGAAGNAPYAASQWLQQLLKSLGVNIAGF